MDLEDNELVIKVAQELGLNPLRATNAQVLAKLREVTAWQREAAETLQAVNREVDEMRADTTSLAREARAEGAFCEELAVGVESGETMVGAGVLRRLGRRLTSLGDAMGSESTIAAIHADQAKKAATG
jgi:hypothetical protein